MTDRRSCYTLQWFVCLNCVREATSCNGVTRWLALLG